MLQILPSNSITADEAIRSLCAREGDTVGANFLKYKGVARDVMRELNLTVIRYTKRAFIKVDKRTNSITVPKKYLHWSSISIIDECDMMRPLIINTNIRHDIVDISLSKDCGCKNNCDSALCHQIKSYEAIETVTEETMPDGSKKSFTSVTRKRLDADGRFYIESTFPVKMYNGKNEWVGYQMKTEYEELCKLEVNDSGCVKDIQANHDKVKCSCQAETFEIEAGCTLSCNPKSPLTYNISEQGDRIVFPSTFAYARVLLRYYENPTGSEILIPIVAKEVFLAGIKHYTEPYKKRPVLWVCQMWEAKYIKGKERLLNLLNRYSIAEWYSALNPKIEMV